ncbi:MAG: tryptophan synthase subunit alpha [Catenulispora sp.]|nr:tryptophan synthase subunit alpha [Catenulispora sp.]
MVEAVLRARRDAGRGLLMPYVTGGIAPGWTDYLRAFADAGADLIEVGLPFSDPTLDGVTIQQASDAALAAGANTRAILADLARAPDVGIPIVISTYYNLVLHDGVEAFCAALREAGVSGLIIPDLPVHEADELADVAAAAGIELALLAAPSTPDPRLAEIAERSRGFVYAVTVMGTTGERADLAASAAGLAARLRSVSDRPVLLGFGISSPDQAREAGRHADGVVVGAAVMRRVLDGAGPGELRDFVATLRQALDQECDPPR